MKLIHDVLNECGYTSAPSFLLSNSEDSQENNRKTECLVMPFLSKRSSYETYLMISVAGSELPHLLDSDFLSSIMEALGRQKFYSSAMDRNTTLLLLCRHEEGEQIDHNARVQIEDDPYYFKKYVFLYTEKDETAALNYIKGKNGSLVEIIRTCLMDSTLFSGYKDYIAQKQKNADAVQKKTAKARKKSTTGKQSADQDNQNSEDYRAYGFFTELTTKITVLPIRPVSDATITSIEKYWEDEVQKKSRIDVVALNNLINIVSDRDTDKQKLDADEILAIWKELNVSQCD